MAGLHVQRRIACMQSKWRAQPPFPSQVYEKRVAKLPQGAAPLYSTQGRNKANENSAVMISFQVCELPRSHMGGADKAWS